MAELITLPLFPLEIETPLPSALQKLPSALSREDRAACIAAFLALPVDTSKAHPHSRALAILFSRRIITRRLLDDPLAWLYTKSDGLIHSCQRCKAPIYVDPAPYVVRPHRCKYCRFHGRLCCITCGAPSDQNPSTWRKKCFVHQRCPFRSRTI